MENLNKKVEITTTKNYQRELKKWTKRLLLFIGIGSTGAGVVNAGQAQADLAKLIEANQITVTQDNTNVANTDDIYRITNLTTLNNGNGEPETVGGGGLDGVTVFGNRIQLNRTLVAKNKQSLTQTQINELNKYPDAQNLFHSLAIKVINNTTASDDDKIIAIISIFSRANPNRVGIRKPMMGGTRHEEFISKEEHQKLVDLELKYKKKRIAEYNKKNEVDDDLFESFTDDDLAESEKALTEAKAKVKKTFTQGRDEVLKAAKVYVANGGNPADIKGWDEIAKRWNITPKDLISN